MFKALILSSFIIATAGFVKAGYAALLNAMDSYVQNGYGQLDQIDSSESKQAGTEITQNYALYRQHY